MSSQVFDPANLSWPEEYLARLLSVGPIPRHVALLGDGNRRWARNNNKNPLWKGHEVGLWNYIKMTRWFRKIGSQEVTLFLISIDNFKRPAEEIQGVLQLIVKAIDIFTGLSDEMRMRVRILGETRLLSEELQEQIKQAEEATGHHKDFTLNLVISYSSRFDIAKSVRRVVAEKNLPEVDVERKLCTSQCHPVDLLIRTGETRLSDFFLWEVSVVFSNKLTYSGLLLFLSRRQVTLRSSSSRNYGRTLLVLISPVVL